MTAPGGPLDSPGERDAVRLVLVRHAESEANIGGRWQGQGDSPLSERGKSQARALAERIARVGLQPDLVVCSDLRRASETARAAFGDAVEVDPLWREIDVGQWEGKTRAEVLAEFAGEVEALRRGEPVRIGADGESWLMVGARGAQALAAVRTRLRS